jgi:hypothetical protein
MLIGHLGVGMALKTWARGGAEAGARETPGLGFWFAAVLFADLACFPLSLAGVERFEYAPEFVGHFPYRLTHAPYSHSLVGLMLFGAVAALAARLGRVAGRAALLLGVAIISHFPTDIIVHGPDMAWAFEPPHLGLALWGHPWISESLELVLLAVGAWLLLRAEPALWGRRFRIFLGGLLVAQTIPSLAPPIENTTLAACSGLLSMSFLVAWGWWGAGRSCNLKARPDE